MVQMAEPLLICLKQEEAAVKVAQLRDFTEKDWEDIFETAGQHSVVPLLFHALKPLVSQLNIPAPVWEEMRRGFYASAACNMRLYRELQNILDIFNNKGINVILLKGAHLAEMVYDNVGLRGMSDVDLLVKKEDLMRMEEELLAQGGVPEDCNRIITQDNFHFGYILPGEGLRVEIHWQLSSNKLPCRVDVEGLWEKAQPVKLGQAEAWVLAPEDLLLHLCQHSAKHAHDLSVRMLCDIAEVVRHYGAGLNWPEIGVRSRSWGITRAIYLFLSLAKELLKAGIPADVLDRLRPDDFDEGYLELVKQQIFTTPDNYSSCSAAKLWGEKGLGDKLKLMGARLLPSREEMSLKYPAPARSWRICLYYPVRWAGVLSRHGVSLGRLALGDKKMQASAARISKVEDLRDWLLSG